MVQFGGDTQDEADDRAQALIDDAAARPSTIPGRTSPTPMTRRVEDELQDVREAGLGATAYPPGKHETYEGWEDAAVPPERLGDYLRDFRKLLRRATATQGASLYGHFGQGCVHTRIPFELRTADGIADVPPVRASDAADLVVSYGGSLSGEHGDGQSRGELLPRMFGAELVARVRRAQGRLRPGRPDEPGQGRRTRTGSTRTCGSARLVARASRVTVLPLPGRRRQLRRGRHRAAWASASAARDERRGDVPVATG